MDEPLTLVEGEFYQPSRREMSQFHAHSGSFATAKEYLEDLFRRVDEFNAKHLSGQTWWQANKGNDGRITRLPNFRPGEGECPPWELSMTENLSFRDAWVASQTDILAEDWCVL